MYTVLEMHDAMYPLRTTGIFVLKRCAKHPLLYMSVVMLLESVFLLKWVHAFSIREL